MTDINSVVTGGGGKTQKVQYFNSSGTWTRPDGVDSVWVFAVGAGGGGGGAVAAAGDASAAGGGGGAQVIPWTPVAVSGNVTVTIGGGGSGGGGSGADGSAGGASSFAGDTTVTARGGGGGAGVSVAGTFHAPTSNSVWSSGGGSRNLTSTTAWGGGGGGSVAPSSLYDYAGRGLSDFNQVDTETSTDLAHGYGGSKATASAGMMPGPGYDDTYGVGGPGGNVRSGVVYEFPWRNGGARMAWANSASAASQAGYDAPANTGSGGGGAASANGGGGAAGGDGADGVIIVVWAE